MKRKEQNMESKNPVLQRTVAFINSHGGFVKVADAIGSSDQSFYSMINRDTKPSVDMLQSFAETFEDFDVNYIVTGRNGNKVVDEMQVTIKRYENIIDSLTEMRGKTEGTLDSPYVDREHASELLSSVIENNAIIRLVKYGIFGYTPGLN